MVQWSRAGLSFSQADLQEKVGGVSLEIGCYPLWIDCH